MAIQKRQRKSGFVYRVLWRDESARLRSRTFSRRDDAETWEAKIKLAKRQGELAQLDAGRQSLEDFIEDWWRLHAEPNLSPLTRRGYERLRDRHVLPRLGQVQLRALTTERLQGFQADLLADGVGRETTRRTMAMLQGLLERATEWGRIPRNPARSVRKPRQSRKPVAKTLSPPEVERLRRYFLERGAVRDATLVSVLAYAGLRPGEALALRWGDILDNTIAVKKALSLGQEKETKTRRSRSVRLLAPLSVDLNEWRLASGRPDETALVFPTREGNPWSELHWRNWRRRRYQRATKALGIESRRPYDLRHSLASLLFAEQRNPAEIAEYMGHSIQMLLSTYVHVIEDLRGREAISAEDEIRSARASHADGDVAQTLPPAPHTVSGNVDESMRKGSEQDSSEKPTPGLEPGTPSLRVKCSTS
jgi:integrase